MPGAAGLDGGDGALVEARPMEFGWACLPGRLQGTEIGLQCGVAGPAYSGDSVEGDPVLDVLHRERF